jgi:hypothetical protein
MSRARPSYRTAVEWIARNDNAGARGSLDLAVVRDSVTVGFVADLFGREQDRVAQDVIDVRTQLEVNAIDERMLREAR